MNKENKTWDKFQMQTVEGKTVAFIGVGDIAQHSARGLQSLFHMKINILKRSKPRNDFKLPEIETKNGITMPNQRKITIMYTKMRIMQFVLFKGRLRQLIS